MGMMITKADLEPQHWPETRSATYFNLSAIPVIADRSMPRNGIELRSGDQRVRVRWPDEATELDRWADDGGRV